MYFISTLITQNIGEILTRIENFSLIKNR